MFQLITAALAYKSCGKRYKRSVFFNQETFFSITILWIKIQKRIQEAKGSCPLLRPCKICRIKMAKKDRYIDFMYLGPSPNRPLDPQLR